MIVKTSTGENNTHFMGIDSKGERVLFKIAMKSKNSK